MKHERQIYASGQGDRLDCSVRAFAVAARIDYETAHELFAKHGRKDNHRTMRYITEAIICEMFPKATFRYGDGMTLRKFVKANPKGHFIVHVRSHALAVCDGVIHDWDEGLRRKVKKAWRLV